MKKLLKQLYFLIPFKKYLFFALRPLSLSDKIIKHLGFRGNVKIRISNNLYIKMYNDNFYIEQRFFWRGLDGWEKYSNKIWTELAKNSDIIFDIGANSGVYSLLAEAVNKSCTVYAFEPIPRIFQLLNENIRLNRFENITAINYALSDHKGIAEMPDLENGMIYESSLEKGFIESLDYLKVKDKLIFHKVNVETLADVITEYNIDRIDLMKIDVETHEPMVIKGMGRFLAKFKPIIIIEILNETVASKLSEYFTQSDYIFYNISEDRGYEKVENLSSSADYNFIICPKIKVNILNTALKNCY
jgi:FkbM family methyltransferase